MIVVPVKQDQSRLSIKTFLPKWCVLFVFLISHGKHSQRGDVKLRDYFFLYRSSSCELFVVQHVYNPTLNGERPLANRGVKEKLKLPMNGNAIFSERNLTKRSQLLIMKTRLRRCSVNCSHVVMEERRFQ